MMRIKALVVLAGLTMACASAGGTGKPLRDSNVITKQDIANAQVYNAYDAIRMLRPAFLSSHGATTLTGSDTGFPRVFLNHQYFGELESLKGFEVSAIREIHYYNSSEASARFGLGNASGVIEVITDAQ
jgi:hypothetical protein